jgi:hypothetical protein
MMLMLGLLYEQLNGITGEELPTGYSELIPAEYSKLMIYFLGLGLMILVFRPPRIVFYALMILILATHVFYYTQVISRWDQDAISNRDDAVEMTARVFTRLENPWSHVPQLGMNATTGPASILFALPFILVFNEINWLATLFWMLLFGFLLIGDVTTRNSTFPVLVLLFVLGIFSFTHTLFWSLDELYFPYLLIALAYLCITRRRLILTGVLLGAAMMFRLNYAFVVLGFMVWYYLNMNHSGKEQLKLLVGIGIAIALVVLPFVFIDGREFWSNNSIITAYSMSGTVDWSSNNIFFRGLNFLTRKLGAGAMRFVKLGLVAGILLFISLQLRRLHQPFYHVTLGSFLALTVAWFPPHLPKDYQLFFLIPAFMAIAFTSKNDVAVFM